MPEPRCGPSRACPDAWRVLALIPVLLQTACTSAYEPTEDPPPDSILTWHNTGGPFLLSYCTE